MSQVGLRLSEETVRRRQRRRSGVAVVLALLLLGGLLGAGYVGVTRVAGLFTGGDTTTAEDYSGGGRDETIFEVRAGDTPEDVARRLQAADVVKSSRSFVEAARADEERANDLQPGFYRMKKQMSGIAAFTTITDDAARAEKRVTVPEGLRQEETVALLAKETGIPARDFNAALKTDIGLPPYAKGKAEGFLFPATYDVPPGAKAADVLKLMTARYAQAARKVGLSQNAGFDSFELVTIASLVEAEARLPGDFGKVSRVIYNRVDAGEPLGFDSTINYILGTSNVAPTNADLKRAASSDYSTYANAGLPPGPINSPGERALAAAAKPPPGDWRWFVTINPDSGETKFTDNYNEFLKFKREFQAKNPDR